jgi:predicted nucleotidyltransferase component of viral defense system
LFRQKSLNANGKNLMFQMSKQDLLREAKHKGYRPEILEKVYLLLDLLEQFMNVEYLKERLVLKGGTAINLFCAKELPRLSVDLDFNYIGSADREIMKQEKIQLEGIISDIYQRRRYKLHRNPRAHAGGKMVLIYQSILGNQGRLEIDLNYIFRVPLWDAQWRSSAQWPKPTYCNVLEIHELAAGKLHALLGREASRDLFDSYQLLTQWKLNPQKLKLAFTVYAGMEQDNWQRIKADNIKFTVKDIRDKLIPVLKTTETPSTSSKTIDTWANHLADECRMALTQLTNFQENEIEFLERLQRFGEIHPELLSNEKSFCQRIQKHPLLIWRAKQAKIKQ